MKSFIFSITIASLFTFSLIGYGDGNKSMKNPNDIAKSAMNKRTSEIPEDIIQRLKHDFENKEEFEKAIGLINLVKQDTLNVGWLQLSRAIILIADGNLDKMRELIESDYHGDPRDVIMDMMGLPDNTNDHGMTPFKRTK